MANRTTWLTLLAGAVMSISVQAAPKTLTPIVNEVMVRGVDSRLPAHLSMVIGVGSGGGATPVKQAVLRVGATVRTFNVCAADRGAVVLVSFNEQNRVSKVYLASAAGVLRKAVSYVEGAPANERSLAEARSDFGHEIDFWVGLGPRRAAPK